MANQKQAFIDDKARQEQLNAFSDTDAGNAEAFELLHGDRFRFDHDRGKYMVWNQRCWVEDRDGEATRAALDTVRVLQATAITISDTNERKKRVKWAINSESESRLDAMLTLARSIKSIATTTEQYDRNPFLLTVGNGTLNLKTGKLMSFRREDLITKAIDVDYDPDATAPRWWDFLEEVFGCDPPLLGFVHRAVGYSLTGETSEQCFFILHGDGANGKSTFIETVCKLLGPLAETAEFSTFLIRRNPGSPRNDVARLHGARLVKASESENRGSLAEALIKEVTGGDTITARYLYREHFSFKPRFKIWLITNHKPDIRGTDHAIWRRVRFIRFTQQFGEGKRDPGLSKRLEFELPGILNWAVEGCLLWQKLGLGEAPIVTEATLTYRQESDQVGRFLKDCCILETDASTPASAFHGACLQWGREQEEDFEGLNAGALAIQLANYGITKKRLSGGMVYIGVELASEAEPIGFSFPCTGNPG